VALAWYQSRLGSEEEKSLLQSGFLTRIRFGGITDGQNFEAYFSVLDLRKRVLYEYVWSSGCSEIADEDPNAEEYVVRAFYP